MGKGEERMTIQEAFEIIKDEIPYESGVINEALKMVEGAVGKQIPRKPDYEGDGYDEDGYLIYDTWICPNCGKHYEVDYDDYNFCPECGQALDWSDNNG